MFSSTFKAVIFSLMNTKSRRFWGCIEIPGFTSQMQVYGQLSECWVKSYFLANKAESSSDWGAPQPQGVQLTTFHFEATNFSGADKTYLISKIFGFHICATSSRWEKIDILRTSPTSPWAFNQSVNSKLFQKNWKGTATSQYFREIWKISSKLTKKKGTQI